LVIYRTPRSVVRLPLRNLVPLPSLISWTTLLTNLFPFIPFHKDKSEYSLTQHIANNLIDMYINLPSKNHHRQPASYTSCFTRRMAADFAVPLIVNVKVAKLLVEALVHKMPLNIGGACPLEVLWPLLPRGRQCIPPERVRCGPADENEVPESRRPLCRDVLDGERDAPGLTEYVKVLPDAEVPDAEVPDEVGQLCYEERRLEEARGLAAQTRRVPSPELVVQDDRAAAFLAEIGMRGHVRM
jgi:hypothetical protein